MNIKNKISFKVGEKMTSLDCTVVYSCSENGKIATAAALTQCGPNAVCSIQNNEPVCVCKAGYFGSNGICSTSNFIIQFIIY
jgi:hypothetical protein